MAHFALVDETKVVREVLTIGNDDVDNLPFPESEPVGQTFIASIGLQGLWLQTSYNNNFRKRHALIGYTYDPDRDAFIPPKPDSATAFDEESCQWIVPVIPID
jgi:hypothetical protein